MSVFGSRCCLQQLLFSLLLLPLFILSPCCVHGWWHVPIREYYIGAVEERWDYAPTGKDQVFASNDSEKYLVNSNNRIGRIYKKVVYKEYTNGQFNTVKPKAAWLGLLGPIVRAEVGDTIVIHFRNMATREFSVHPHGVRYTKGNEGALYLDNTFGPLKKDEHVQPGETFKYTWNITHEFAPPEGDTPCISWVYHSHINTPIDTNSGLIGPLITCRKGTLRNDGSRIDGVKEFMILAKTYDENMSFYNDQNRKLCGDPKLCDKLAEKEDEDYMDSNQMRAFNGFVYGNGPRFDLNTHETVIWYVLGMGNEAGIHGVQFGGQVIKEHGQVLGTIAAMQASFKSATMTPVFPGQWLISCAVTEHYTDGMLAFLNVKSTGINYEEHRRYQPSWKVNKYYLSIEEHLWDYAPSGKNLLTGIDLAKDPNTEGTYTSGPHRIGRQYWKASFFQYKSSNYTTKIKTPGNMGLLGPVIRVTEGEKVTVFLKNNAKTRPYSFLPHGVTFTKSNEGAVYNNGNITTGKIVQPGEIKSYEFFAPLLGTSDPMCKVLLYQSSVNHVKDLNTGLIGPLLVCKRFSIFRKYFFRQHLEYFLLFNTFDENHSWYLDKNIKNFTTDPQGVDVTAGDFLESNKKHSINGLVYANLRGLNMYVGDTVDWHVMSFGNEQDVHSPHFHGHTFQQSDFRQDTSDLIPAQSWSFSMKINNPGRWLVECLTTIHFKEGMRTFYNVNNGYSHTKPVSKQKIRRYFIAAEEINWDFAPKKRDIVTGDDLNNEDENGNIYIRHNKFFIGSIYKKALFREYTDNTFNQRMVRDSSNEHLGIMGPIIRAEVGETIEVYFKNKASRPYSMLPHGLLYKNDEDGELYNASNPSPASKVMPNSTYNYTWSVPLSAGPGKRDPNCIMWQYTSAVNQIKDVYSGLIGPIIICRKGILNNIEKRMHIDKEFVFLFWVLDENQSWYFDENIKNYAPGRVNGTRDEDFHESNLFHSINGQIYGNNEGLLINKGDSVAWYLMSYGSEKDVHTVHLHGQTFIHSAGMRQRSDVITLTPSITRQVEFLATNPGTWFLHCHVNDHINAGMETVYTILDKHSHLVSYKK